MAGLAGRARRIILSLRFSLPLLLLAYCAVVGAVLYVLAGRSQDQRVEQEFLATQLLRAVELQSRTERAAEQGELTTGQQEFYQLGALEALRAAVFVAPDNRVLLTNRREWLNRAVDLSTSRPSAWRRLTRRPCRTPWPRCARRGSRRRVSLLIGKAWS